MLDPESRRSGKAAAEGTNYRQILGRRVRRPQWIALHDLMVDRQWRVGIVLVVPATMVTMVIADLRDGEAAREGWWEM